jgi:hypothetical protein
MTSRNIAALTLLIALLLSACSQSPTVPTAAPTLAPAVPTSTPAPVAPTTAATTAPAAPAAPTATPAPPAPTTAPPAAPTIMPPTATARPQPTGPPPTATPEPAAAPQASAGLPQRIRIPRLRIDTSVEHVGLTQDGAMDVPKRYDTVGWYKLGTRPGEIGSAVMAGHLDSKTGPAIFWRLRELRPGDDLFVRSDDGQERRFVVQGTETYRFDDAPLERIFAAADGALLNLITCGGTFDRRSENYDQRLVVFAALAG